MERAIGSGAAAAPALAASADAMTRKERAAFDELYGQYLLAETSRRALRAENEAFVLLLEQLLTGAQALLGQVSLDVLRDTPTSGRMH